MGFLDKLKEDGLINTTLNTLGKNLANKYLDGIMELKEVKMSNKKPMMVFTLNGLDHEFTAEVGCFSISEDGSKVMFGDYHSNMPFIENALNKFAAKTIEISDPKAQTALVLVRKVL